MRWENAESPGWERFSLDVQVDGSGWINGELGSMGCL